MSLATFDNSDYLKKFKQQQTGIFTWEISLWIIKET